MPTATAAAPASGDVVTVTSTTAVCDGTADHGGHPRVYLKIDPDSREVMCPYCSRTFKLDPSVKADGH